MVESENYNIKDYLEDVDEQENDDQSDGEGDES